MLSSATSLRRTHAHITHLLEDWSRAAEDKFLAQEASLFDTPDHKPMIPPIEYLDLASRILFRLTAIDKTLNPHKPETNAAPSPSPALPSPSAGSDSISADGFGVQTPACSENSHLSSSSSHLVSPAPFVSLADHLPPLAVDPAKFMTDITPDRFSPTQARVHQWALDHIDHGSARDLFSQHLQLAPAGFRLPVFMTDPRWQDPEWVEAAVTRDLAIDIERRKAAEAAADANPRYTCSRAKRPDAPVAPASPSAQSPVLNAQSSISDSTLSASADTSLHPASAGVPAAKSVSPAGLSRLSVPAVPCVPGLPSISSSALSSSLDRIAAATEDLLAKTNAYALANDLPLPALDPDPSGEPSSPKTPISRSAPQSNDSSLPDTAADLAPDVNPTPHSNIPPSPRPPN
ncbi:hypothetical protein LLG95_13830 [bacterium]|nr:hypothetical protein [bacterium]